MQKIQEMTNQIHVMNTEKQIMQQTLGEMMGTQMNMRVQIALFQQEIISLKAKLGESTAAKTDAEIKLAKDEAILNEATAPIE